MLRRAMRADFGSRTIAGVEVPLHLLISIVGVALWLLVTVLLTSLDDTLAAAVANVGFVAGLCLIASITRTVSLVTVMRAFLLGASAMALMLLVAQPLGGLSSDPSSGVDPIAEELLKLAPLGVLLWQARRVGVWQLGATDILLLCVASGAGFALVEDAYIRMNEGWGDTLPFLPTTEIYDDRIRGSRIIPGHAIWTGLAGVTIGLAWLMSHIRALLLVAPLGFILATANHIANNGGFSMPELAIVVVVLFVAGVVGLIALDMYVLLRKLPAVPELDAALARPATLPARWRRMLESRRLRFAAWRFAPRSATSGAAQQAVESSVIELVDAQSG